MVKKLATILAAVGVLATSGNCCTVAPASFPRNLIVEEETTLEDLVRYTHCIRTDVFYEDKDGNRISPTIFGSSFAYRENDGHYYLITNEHVLGKSEITVAGRDYTLKDLIVSIVPSQFEDDAENFIILEPVFASEELDIAVLRTRMKLEMPQERFFGDSSSLRYGDEVYLVGYPMGLFPTITKGIVANPGYYPHQVFLEDEELDISVPASAKKILDVSVNPGNSGGPFFATVDGETYWMGIVDAYVADSKGRNTGLAVSMGSNVVSEIVDYAISNAESFIKIRTEKEIKTEVETTKDD